MGANRRIGGGAWISFAAAAGLYGLWATLLFWPHANLLSSSFRLLFALNPVVGALGVFVLSRRWLAAWLPGVIAGLLYGFGPFGLSFMGFHPIAGLTFAAVPWLLLPAVYWKRGQSPTLVRFAGRAALCGLPFAFILVFFWVFSQHWIGPLFLLPKKTMLSGCDLGGLVLPLSMTHRPVILGLYHAGVLAALMGLFVYLSAQRVTVLIPAAAGLALAFLNPVLGVSPAIWLALPMVFLTILAGLGSQALLWAGKADSKWVLACVAGALVLAGACVVLHMTGSPGEYRGPLVFYGAAAVGFGILFVLSRRGIRSLPLRWLLIAGIIGADSFWSAHWLIDSFF